MKTSRLKVSVLITASVFMIMTLLILGQASAETEKPKQVKNRRLEHGAGTPTPLSGYILPFNRRFVSRITNGPGEGRHTGASSEAIDFDPVGNWDYVYDPEYRQVRTAKRGWVYINNTYDDWGRLLIIRHADGFYTYYAHLDSVTAGLTPGTLVRKKQVIGIVGQSGCEDDPVEPCGPHLHFEARDLMTPTPSANSAYHGSSSRHSVRRILGIGWGPWYPEVLNVLTLNSGLNVSSNSHVVGKCSGVAQIISRWPGADSEFDDVHNGHQITGYSYDWNTTLDFTPDITPEAGHGVLYAINPSKPMGPNPGAPLNYYFHFRIRSNNYGWSNPEEVAHQGPYKLAAGCPTPSPEEWADPPSESDP